MEIHPNHIGFYKRWLNLDTSQLDEVLKQCHKNHSNHKQNCDLIDPVRDIQRIGKEEHNKRKHKKHKKKSNPSQDQQHQHQHHCHNCPNRIKNKSRVDSTGSDHHSRFLEEIFNKSYRNSLHLYSGIMPPISDKRSPTIIKENTKENIASSKTLCDKLSNRVPEILDFRDSWLQEIDLYKDQLRAQQLLAQHNHIHTPDGCIRENCVQNSKDAVKITSESIKRRLQTTRSDSEPNDGNKIRSMKDSNDEHDRLREDSYQPQCNNSNNQQYHQNNTVTSRPLPTLATSAAIGTSCSNNPGQNSSMITTASYKVHHTNPYHAQVDKTKTLSHGFNVNSIPSNIDNVILKNNASNKASNKVNSVNGTNHKTPVKSDHLNGNTLPPSVKDNDGTNSSKPSDPVEHQNNCVNGNVNSNGNDAAKEVKDNNDGEKKDDLNKPGTKADDEYLSDYGDEDDVLNIDEEDASCSESEDEYKGDIFLLNVRENLSTSDSSSLKINDTGYKTPSSIFTPSLFPNVPPYLSFASHTEAAPSLPPELQKILKWKLTSVMPRIVRRIIINSGCRLIKKTNEWMGTWEKHMKNAMFKTLNSYQKFNHLPGTFKIGRKDSLWRNLRTFMTKYSKKDFGFMQKTFILPQEVNLLKRNWPKSMKHKTKWIIKPPASARGTGIKVISRWSQIPKDKPVIVQKYIERPLLIEGNKFDLRLYVAVTSVNPLRIYMYQDGLARFASVQYSDKLETLNDRCMHLTNYSINKLSASYSKNEDIEACQGHKWTLKSLWKYFHQKGVNTTYLWGTLRNLVIRTIISGEGPLNNLFRTNVNSRYNCYELFGFDVLLDENLTPWLLEVNISPSLHSELPLDMHVKGPLVQAVLNTALYQVPPKLNAEQQKSILNKYNLTGPLCYDKRMFVTHLSAEEKKKHNYFTSKAIDCRDEYLDTILENLTPDDLRCLIISADELARCHPLERIFPTPNSYKYLDYITGPRYYNRLLDAWESNYFYDRENGIKCLQELCENKLHLEVAPLPPNKQSVDIDNPDNTESTENGDNPDNDVSVDDDKNSLDNCDSLDDVSEKQQKQNSVDESVQKQQSNENCHKQSASAEALLMQVNGNGPRPIAVETK